MGVKGVGWTVCHSNDIPGPGGSDHSRGVRHLWQDDAVSWCWPGGPDALYSVEYENGRDSRGNILGVAG